MEEGGTVEAERSLTIDLTEADVIAANFAALGIANESKIATPDRVLEAYTAHIAEHKRVPTAPEIAKALGLSVTSVRNWCRELAADGKMLRFQAKSGQWAYMPKVTG